MKSSGKVSCDLLCKLKAAAAIVPIPVEKYKSISELLLAKFEVIEEISTLSATEFTKDPAVFSSLYEAVTANIFFNSQEYTRTFTESYELHFDSSKDPSEFIIEPALEDIILPLHSLLLSIFKLYKISVNESERQLIRSKFSPSFIQLLVPLLETPIDEERESFAALFSYIAQNLDSDYLKALIESFDFFTSKILENERPVRGVDHILSVATHMVVFCSKSAAVRQAFTNLAENTLSYLHAHPHFILFHDEYNQFFVYFLRFFHLKDDMDVKRTPFDPMFPVETPFLDDDFVQDYRKDFLSSFPNSDPKHPNPNQLAYTSLILYLSQHQFYPRRMIPDILRTFLMNIPYSSNDAVLGALTSLTDDEIFDQADSVRREVLHLLWTTQTMFEKPSDTSVLDKISPEL